MADAIKNFPARLYKMTETFCHEVPSQVAVRRFVDELTNVMFPVRDDKHISEVQIAARWEKLQQDFLKIICPLCSCKQVDCKELTQKFFGEIPLVYTGLVRDAEMYSTCDPASYCIEEVILCYPGFYAIMVYRIAHIAYRLQIPVLPRVMTEYAHSQTGIDINPGAQIGRRLVIDHGAGIVIGETTQIGDDCLLYQGVTLGGTGKDVGKRHPTLGNNVMVGSGAKVLGPFRVGDNARIAANAVVLREVPSGATVVGVPGRIVRLCGDKLDHIHTPDPVMLEIEELKRRMALLEEQLSDTAKEN